jgi:hypothetical protein
MINPSCLVKTGTVTKVATGFDPWCFDKVRLLIHDH